jgi:nucleoid-associated protein YgaU
MGYVGNNGTTDVDYQASIAQRTAAAPTGTQGAFRNGATTGASYSDFDQSYNPINSYEQGANAGVYTVRKGDTLQGIAAGLYGDSALWYKIAEVNGLSGQTALIEGQSLTLIHAGASRRHPQHQQRQHLPTL